MVKAKEGKEHRDEESKKNWKADNEEALIALRKMELEFAQNAKKHVRFQFLQCHIVHLEFLQGKKQIFKLRFGIFRSKRKKLDSN